MYNYLRYRVRVIPGTYRAVARTIRFCDRGGNRVLYQTRRPIIPGPVRGPRRVAGDAVGPSVGRLSPGDRC